ncbi:hypothetical protein BLNAU_16801 [Blattamonas nauphoetae]|uniref:Uncharacterized protein n=1 Tax=Blattamonas nauphoetae TaxID=2049346 RepID=A0ABQ9XDH0_9EUKA|nr:hypothetical protein BLNAU_16801 [Blattamonas nauphoetae]
MSNSHDIAYNASKTRLSSIICGISYTGVPPKTISSKTKTMQVSSLTMIMLNTQRINDKDITESFTNIASFWVTTTLSHAASIQDLVDAFSANSNTLLLSETEYDGEDVELKHSNLRFIGQDHSIIVQPEVASNGLFVVLEMSHSLENVDSTSANTTVSVSASAYKNVTVTSTSPLLCSTSTRFVKISSSSFKTITFVPASSNEDADDSLNAEEPTKETNELVSVTISSSSFNDCEAALEFTIVPALSATSFELSSSDFNHCGLTKAVPEYVTNGPQKMRISSSSFSNQNVGIGGKAGFLTFDSDDGELEITSSDFHTFSTTDGSGVLCFKKGSRLTLKSTTFSTVTSLGALSACVVIEAIPQNLVIRKSFFRNCRSSGKGGAIVVRVAKNETEPSNSEQTVISSASLYDNWFWKNTGTKASDIFIEESALAYFDCDSFGEMSSYSSSPHVLDASGTKYALPVSISRLLKRFVWSFVVFGVGLVVAVAGIVMCCVGVCCCGCCPCCCCRRTRRCCGSGRMRVCCEDDSVPHSECQPAQHAPNVPLQPNANQPVQYVYAMPPSHPAQMQYAVGQNGVAAFPSEAAVIVTEQPNEPSSLPSKTG